MKIVRRLLAVSLALASPLVTYMPATAQALSCSNQTNGYHCPSSINVAFNKPCGDGWIATNVPFAQVVDFGQVTIQCCVAGHEKTCDYEHMDCQYYYVEDCGSDIHQSRGFDQDEYSSTGCNWDGHTLCGG